MLKKEIKDIIIASMKWGWVLEPDAKRIMALSGIDVPQFIWARNPMEATEFANKIGYPVVIKVVSHSILHKSDVDGVIVGVKNDEEVRKAFERLSTYQDFEGILVEEMVSGSELIIGAKVDYQFGPVILLGMGGTEVEIYKDTTLRMAPLDEHDAISMLKGLKAHSLLEGYRGAESVDLQQLSHVLVNFSRLVMKLEKYIESIDLNPLMCSSKRCVVADARIILNRNTGRDI